MGLMMALVRRILSPMMAADELRAAAAQCRGKANDLRRRSIMLVTELARAEAGQIARQWDVIAGQFDTLAQMSPATRPLEVHDELEEV
jgi:hypothetical protein